MRLLYSLLFYLLLPLVLLRLLWRSRRAPAYRRRWSERLALFRPPAGERPIWLHAVSVGEVLAALPLIRALKARHPGRPLLVTTTTPTGSERVRAALGGEVLHVYAPYDLPDVVGRFLRRMNPALVVVMETELWPNLFHRLRRRRIPLLLLNARLSPRSAGRYRRLGGLAARTVRCVDVIAAQSAADAGRFGDIGADPAQLLVAGNLKFDLELPAELAARGRALRARLGAGRPVWIAASTHGGEDEQVLAAHQSLRRRHPDLLLILVPRHPERFERVAALCRAGGLAVARHSRADSADAAAVYLGDSMGELPLLLAAADVAFVGGSLVPTGGHNMLEPAALGLPVLSGPHLFNFREIGDLLLAAGALRVVEHADGLATAVGTLLANPTLRAEIGAKSQRVVRENRGALARCLALIDQRLPPGEPSPS